MSISRNNVGSLQNTGSDFQWKIDNFSTSCKKVGDCISSPIFLTHCFHREVEWKLRLYSKDNNSDRICEYKLKNQTFNGYKNKGMAWGFPKYVERGYVMNKINNILSMDRLRILCKITYEVNYVPSTLLDAKIIDGCMIDQTSGHSDDLESLFESGNYSDVTFLVGGCKIKAHKAIITNRSPVFKIMFEHDMIEKNENVIKITDISCGIMKELLRFVYANKVNHFRTHARNLLLASEKYSIDRLKDLCEKEIARNIKFKNVFKKLVLADRCNAKFLKSRAIDFISKHLNVVIDNPEFQEFVSQHQDLMSKVVPGGVL